MEFLLFEHDWPDSKTSIRVTKATKNLVPHARFTTLMKADYPQAPACCLDFDSEKLDYVIYLKTIDKVAEKHCLK